MSTPLLEVQGLQKSYAAGPRSWTGKHRGTVRAVDQVSFSIPTGGALGLVGESGCGKSTVARLLTGLEKADGGSIRLAGDELVGLSERKRLPYRRRVQMVFQDPYGSLDPRQTIGSILTEPLAIQRIGKPRERLHRAVGLLEAVGLKARDLNSYPHQFSGGQRQRIVIARALALEPELLVCDEPVSALDVSIQAQIINLLKELRERFDLAYLFIAHDLAVVRQVCDRVCVMYLGQIVEEGSRTELFEDPRHPYTRALLSAIPTPDPAEERKRQRIVLQGDVPSPFEPPTGCTFHPRCPERETVGGERCQREEPSERTSEGRRWSCHLDEVAPPVAEPEPAPAPPTATESEPEPKPAPDSAPGPDPDSDTGPAPTT